MDGCGKNLPVKGSSVPLSAKMMLFTSNTHIQFVYSEEYKNTCFRRLLTAVGEYVLEFGTVTVTWEYQDVTKAPPKATCRLVFKYSAEDVFLASTEMAMVVCYDMDTWPNNPKLKYSSLTVYRYPDSGVINEIPDLKNFEDPFSEGDFFDMSFN